MLLRSAPIRILSLASSKSIIMTTLRFWRAALRAGSDLIGRVALFGLAHHHALALRAHQDLVLGELEIDHHDDFAILAGGVERGFRSDRPCCAFRPRSSPCSCAPRPSGSCPWRARNRSS